MSRTKDIPDYHDRNKDLVLKQEMKHCTGPKLILISLRKHIPSSSQLGYMYF